MQRLLMAILGLSLVSPPGCKQEGSEHTTTLLGTAPEESAVASPKTLVQRIVDVPYTADEARAMHAPPHTTVTVKAYAVPLDAQGGSGCGRAGLACAVLMALPVPDEVKHQGVTIIAPDREIRAIYTEGGALESAQVLAGGEVQHVEPRSSNRLNRRFVVEVGRSAPGPDGQPGELRRTSVLGQLPELRAVYLAAFVEDQRPREKRGTLDPDLSSRVGFTCADLSRVLGADAIELGREYLASPQLEPPTKEILRAQLDLGP